MCWGVFFLSLCLAVLCSMLVKSVQFKKYNIMCLLFMYGRMQGELLPVPAWISRIPFHFFSLLCYISPIVSVIFRLLVIHLFFLLIFFACFVIRRCRLVNNSDTFTIYLIWCCFISNCCSCWYSNSNRVSYSKLLKWKTNSNWFVDKWKLPGLLTVWWIPFYLLAAATTGNGWTVVDWDWGWDWVLFCCLSSGRLVVGLLSFCRLLPWLFRFLWLKLRPWR